MVNDFGVDGCFVLELRLDILVFSFSGLCYVWMI